MSFILESEIYNFANTSKERDKLMGNPQYNLISNYDFFKSLTPENCPQKEKNFNEQELIFHLEIKGKKLFEKDYKLLYK